MSEIQKYAVDEAMADVEALLADAELAQRRGENDDPMAWLAPWFIQQDKDIDAFIATVKEQAGKLIKQAETRRKGLWWKWGDEFQSQVRKDLANQGGKKKSVDYLTGRAGVRTKSARTEVVVLDAGRASLELDKVCPDAVRYSVNKSEVLKYHNETGAEVPGIEFRDVPASESFYPKRPDTHQLEVTMAAALPQEGENDE